MGRLEVGGGETCFSLKNMNKPSANFLGPLVSSQNAAKKIWKLYSWKKKKKKKEMELKS